MLRKRNQPEAPSETWTPNLGMALIRSESLGELVGYANDVTGRHVKASVMRRIRNANDLEEDVTDALIRTATMPLLTLGPVLDAGMHITDAQSVIFLPQQSYPVKYTDK